MEESIGSEVTPAAIFDALKSRGIGSDDPRFHQAFSNLFDLGLTTKVSYEQFSRIIQSEQGFFTQVMSDDLVIPDFQGFSNKIREIYETAKDDDSGHVASYIPQLARVDPNKFGVSICTIDGQYLNLGEFNDPFCVQSTCKPVNYCLAIEEHGLDTVHRHVGHEPSGGSFNAMSLNDEGLPHNPMINSGAIMTCSLIQPQSATSDRFEHVLATWRKACNSKQIGFNNSVYLSERETADRNFALAYFMKEKKAFPANTDLYKTLEFYFQCCSIETTTKSMAALAATLASGGFNPFTSEKIFKSATVKNCLSLMNTCGMYDYSGEFAFDIGLPAKSGVSGVVLLVVPNTLGICLWSPRLDVHGNSVRAVNFCRQLVKTFLFHNYDSLVADHENKINPRLIEEFETNHLVQDMCFAAAHGNKGLIRNLMIRGANINDSDYDLRTPLHLAVCENQTDTVEYLIGHGAKPDAKDRWGQTPRDEAARNGSKRMLELLTAASSPVSKRSGAQANLGTSDSTPGISATPEPKTIGGT